MSEMTIKDRARELQAQLIAWRREFHQCPELKMDTPITEGKIIRILKEIGIEEIKSGIGGHGVACIIRGANPGECLGIRADCDGLPIREETGLPFASTNGNMHACGHDAHTAMALGAAKIIWERRAELKGTVKFIFQPFEEGDGGAKAMIADHVLENPRVDSMIALHTGNLMGPDFASGDIAYHPQISSFAIRTFYAKFKGKSTHASTPQEGIDPLLTACYAVTEIQTLLSRERSPAKSVVCSVNIIRGGVRNNIIPDECYIEGTIRSTSKVDQDYYFTRVEEICKGVSRSMRCDCEVGQIFDLMPSVNAPKMVNKLLRIAPKIVCSEHIRKIDTLSPIGEDFARFADVVPSVYFFHCSAKGGNPVFPHHNPRFDVDESVLWSGAALFAQFAMDWQNEDD